MSTFNTPTLVTLTAPTCSGKSYLLNELTNRGVFSRIVSTTTRPQRSGEVEGVDYFFINSALSRAMEHDGEFFELIEFNGTRYGVTHAEMSGKMSDSRAPIVILEPQGLEIYEQKCRERGWNIFKIYVHVTEEVRIQRLLQRSLGEAWSMIDNLNTGSTNQYSASFNSVAREEAKKTVAKIINEHQRRLLSITGDERRWQQVTSWDAIVPGDDVEKALAMIEQGIKWRNRKEATPQAVGSVALPL